MSASAVNPGLFQPLRQQRALLWGLLVSIALHALILLGISQHELPAPPSTALLVLTARLATETKAPREQPPPSRPQSEPPPAPKPAPTPHPAPKKPLSTPEPAVPKAAPVESAKPAPPEPAAATPANVASSAPSAAPSQAKAAPLAPVGAKTEATTKSGSDVDNGTLERYRLALIVATRRYKRYPAIAMEKGWQGKVEVHMVIGANGMLADASIKTSSGHEILDNQAIDMLKKGKTTVQIPAGLRGREFSIDVPVIFNLDDPGS